MEELPHEVFAEESLVSLEEQKALPKTRFDQKTNQYKVQSGQIWTIRCEEPQLN